MSAKGEGLPDAAQREQAVTDFESNLVVLAGAGTGKTSLLVERILNAIGAGRVKMGRLAAITFTEKAAGEMRERIAIGLDRVRELARGAEPDQSGNDGDRAYRWLSTAAGIDDALIARRALNAMVELDGATVTTIHGFCSELLHAHPREAGVDPSFIVDSGEHQTALWRELWEAFLVEELGPQALRSELWSGLLDTVPLATIGDVAEQLASFLIPPELREPDRAFPDPRELLSPETRRVRKGVAWILEPEQGVSGVSESFFRHSLAALDAFLDEGLPGVRRSLDGASDFVQRVRGQKGKPNHGKTMKVPRGDFKRILDDALHLLRGLDRADDTTVGRILEAVGPFVDRFREAYLKRGLVSFDGLLALCRDLLRNHPELRRRIKQRYEMLLIDEFQDTDPLQYEIVLLLAESPDDSADDAYQAELQPGRLFVVGDAKQSIYRFRGADYAAYRRAIDRICERGGTKLDLIGNFRSVPGLVDPANRLFEAENGCWQPSPYQPDYVPIQAIRDGEDDDPRLELWTVEVPPKSKASDRRQREGQLIAEAIESWIKQGRCSYRQVTLLFRAFAPITHYLRALREREIPFVVDGGKEFLRRPEILQLMATFRTLSLPSDPPALLAFLRSASAGASDRELAAYAESGGVWDWRSDADAGRFPRIAAGFRVLRETHDEICHLPADAAVRRVLERTDLLPLGAIAFEGPQRVANLRKLVAAAAELARDGRLSLEEVVEGLDRGLLEDLKTDRPLSDDAAEAVRITSIHRMKGLENDWVILPDMARERNTWGFEAAPRVHLVTRHDGHGLLAIQAGEKTNSAAVLYELEHRRHEAAEENRVLYVAMTRARERLIVLAARPARGETPSPSVAALRPWGYDPLAPPPDGSLLVEETILHRIPQTKPPLRLVEQPVSDRHREAVRRYKKARASLEAQARPPLAAPSGLHEEAEASRESGRPPFAGRSRDLGRGVGVTAHRLLEGWDRQDPESLRRRLPALAAETARQLALAPLELERETAQVLDGFLDSELVGRLQAADLIGVEVPVLLKRDGGGVMNGSIDLLYRDEDARLVIADYKTDADEEPDALRERYREQLGVYVEAVTLAYEPDRPPRAELWLLRSGRRIELASA